MCLFPMSLVKRDVLNMNIIITHFASVTQKTALYTNILFLNNVYNNTHDIHMT